jgi:hypothetical protein
MVEEMLAARRILVTYETIRQWGPKFGREFANRIRRRAPRRGDKWHPDEVVITIAGKKHWKEIGSGPSRWPRQPFWVSTWGPLWALPQFWCRSAGSVSARAVSLFARARYG